MDADQRLDYVLAAFATSSRGSRPDARSPRIRSPVRARRFAGSPDRNHIGIGCVNSGSSAVRFRAHLRPVQRRRSVVLSVARIWSMTVTSGRGTGERIIGASWRNRGSSTFAVIHGPDLSEAPRQCGVPAPADNSRRWRNLPRHRAGSRSCPDQFNNGGGEINEKRRFEEELSECRPGDGPTLVLHDTTGFISMRHQAEAEGFTT